MLGLPSADQQTWTLRNLNALIDLSILTFYISLYTISYIDVYTACFSIIHTILRRFLSSWDRKFFFRLKDKLIRFSMNVTRDHFHKYLERWSLWPRSFYTFKACQFYNRYNPRNWIVSVSFHIKFVVNNSNFIGAKCITSKKKDILQWDNNKQVAMIRYKINGSYSSVNKMLYLYCTFEISRWITKRWHAAIFGAWTGRPSDTCLKSLDSM